MLFYVATKPHKPHHWALPVPWFISLSAMFITLSANLAFYTQLTAVYPVFQHPAFIVSLLAIIFALNTLLILLLWAVVPLKWAVNLLLVISVFCAYFSDQFGVVIDSEMVRNSVETNIAEAADLLSLSLVWRILALGLVPIFVVYRLQLTTSKPAPSWLVRLLTPTIMALLALILIAALILANSAQFSSFIRQHKPLRYYINPLQPIVSVLKYYTSQFESISQQPFAWLAGHSATPADDRNRELVIMVVGETVRADHFSLNGYQRNTNPLLSQEKNLLTYPNITSCGTTTAISVPCMFSLSPRASFDVDTAKNTENALDIIARAGVSVLWRDNNSDSKGVALRQRYEDFRSPLTNKQCDTECRDTGILDGLQQFIDQQDHDILIVLHPMGSHGPAYYKRYPAEFEQFTPACHSAELSACSEQEIVNAYDNTMLYNDFFLSQIITLLKANQKVFQTSMLYVGDHGESLGENGLYLHGLPYAFAPDSQKHVPILLWTDSGSDIDIPATRQQSQVANSHDAVAKALISLFEIETDVTFADTPDLLRFKPAH